MLAGRPVDSSRRLAARPVGAASATRVPMRRKLPAIQRISVVLPVPGPPVSTPTLLSSSRDAAACCAADSSIPVPPAAAAMAAAGPRAGVASSAASRSAARVSAAAKWGR